MSLILASSVVITAPALVDGRGEVATLNDSASGTYVGRVFKPSGFGGATVRTSMDNIVEGSGAVFGDFYDGPRSFTLEVSLARTATWALSDARYNKLCRAFDAKRDDGSLAFVDTDEVTKTILFRREQPPSDPDENGHVLLAGIAEDPRIYGAAVTAGAGSFAVGGTTGTFPTFTLTAPTNTITLSRTSPSPTETLTLTGLSGAGTVTVNFLARTVTATSGAANRYSAVSFPSSIWWELAPGVSNTVAVSGATISGSGISYRPAWSSA